MTAPNDTVAATLFDADTLEPQPRMRGQWRLAEVQLANWGTFDGAIYRIPIARQGHLLTGPSGSGKSSLLDAIAAVLTPDKWLRFNEAAQGAGSRSDRRSLISYVRGAWSRTTDEHEDRIVSAQLRDRATWSGIILRYENGVDRPVTLCRLFFLRGTGVTIADLTDLCLLDRSAVDLRQLEPHARGGIDTRKVQAAWPDAVITTNGGHSRFYSKLRSLFGIAHESALQLLHKTQSAKSLDSLDQLFRDYMLDRPTTFALADTAVEQFSELRDAHDHVVQLRMQRDHLLQLRRASGAFDTANTAADAARDLAAAVVPYQKRSGLKLAHGERTALDERLVVLGADAERADAAHRRAEEQLESAQRRVDDLGGSEVQHLRVRLGTARDAAAATEKRWNTMAHQLAFVGVDRAPDTAAEFAELLAHISAMVGMDPAARPSHEHRERYFTTRDTVRRLEEAIRVLRTGTTVPGDLVAVRRALTAELQLPATAIPFAAELLEVRPEHAVWTGAIERVLRPFALTLLVRSEHLAAVRRWVDAHRVDARLVFEEVASNAPPPRPARTATSLVNRVAVSPGPFADWVAGQLSERFDYACVDSPDEMDEHTRAVTINGQVKSSRTRYEKDDRVAIDDRAQWVLGDRRAKEDILLAQLRAAEVDLADAQGVLDRLEQQHKNEIERRVTLSNIREQSWNDLDRHAANAHVAELDERLRALTDARGDLQSAVQDADAAREARSETEQRREDARHELRNARDRLAEVTAVIEEVEEAIASGEIPAVDDEATDALARRFRTVQRSITRQNIAEVGLEVTRVLQAERDRALETARLTGNEVATLATQFKERWPASATDLTASVADRSGYIELLDGIVAHRLPDHEVNFRRLLRERSRDLIGDLVSDILRAPREIEDRVDPVNTSLRRSKFDEGRYLQLRVKTRRSDTVTRFIADLRSISEGAWTDDDDESAERRFATLEEVMRRFASSDHVDRTWKTQCLDTRLHVTFLADETDEHGRVHATYDSGAAMSGGQQQKLVVFCLAAALRYQLADSDAEHPRYGTVVLDEAFDKADTRYTRMALDVFVEFGFQLVLATPQKLLQTIEPYVGAATAIENPTRRRSEVANVPWRVVTESGDAGGDGGAGAAAGVEQHVRG